MNNIQSIKKWFSGAVIVLSLIILNSSTVEADTRIITVGTFVEMIEEKTSVPIIDELISKSNPLLSKPLTNQVAAVIIEKVDEMINGETFDGQMYQAIVNNNRIHDIDKASAPFQESLIKCYLKGIMIGRSCGLYSQQRYLSPTGSVHPHMAKIYVDKLKYKVRRIKLTNDGQVIRVINLPSNKENYEYILADFPNEYYEAGKTRYENEEGIYISPKELRDKQLYGNDSESTLGMYGAEWAEIVKYNIYQRLNYNYKSSNHDEWAQNVIKGMYRIDDEKTKELLVQWTKDNILWAKEDKLVMETEIVSTDISSLYYYFSTLYIRVYARAKISAANLYTAKSGDQNRYIFGSDVFIPSLDRQGEWVDVFLDVPIGSLAMNESGAGVHIIDQSLFEAER